MIVARRWRLDHDRLLADVRSRFSYSEGENRATGYLDGPWLEPILAALNDRFGVVFDVVVFQAYRDGRAGCDWHADDNFASQAIVSLGVSRLFGIRRGDVEQFTRLDAGDLVYLPTAEEHCVPLEPDVHGERVSLVFRAPG